MADLFNLGTSNTSAGSAQLKDPTSTLAWRQALGNATSYVGDKIGIPESGISEWIAGGPTKDYNKASAAEGYHPAPNTSGGGGSWGDSGSSTGGMSQDEKNNLFRSLGLGDIAPVGWNGPSQVDSSAVTNEINSGFNDIFSQLDQLAGLIPGYQKQAEEGVRDTYGKISSGIGEAKANADKTIDLSKQQVQSGVDKSVLDIQNSLRSLLKGAQAQIGSLGAGNSSVAQTLLPYAFSKQYAQQRGNIQGQANSQFTDLAKKQLDVQTTFQQQKNDLDVWENNQMETIRQTYQSQLGEIANARMNATGQRAQALAALQTNLLNQAYNELNTIRTNANQFKQNLQTWALDRLSTLEDSGKAIMSAGQYTPQAINYAQIAGLGQMSGSPVNSDQYFTPFQVGAKKQDQSQF